MVARCHSFNWLLFCRLLTAFRPVTVLSYGRGGRERAWGYIEIVLKKFLYRQADGHVDGRADRQTGRQVNG